MELTILWDLLATYLPTGLAVPAFGFMVYTISKIRDIKKEMNDLWEEIRKLEEEGKEERKELREDIKDISKLLYTISGKLDKRQKEGNYEST